MGKDTGIEWTDSTWNPWAGCQKVSQGCKHCYMFRDQKRYGNDPKVIRRTKDPTFYAPKRKREFGPLVFTCSWSDFFIEDADDWRDDAWGVIRDTPHLTYQILTKRPERIADHLPNDWGDGWANVWLGVSVENDDVTERIAVLQDIPAAVRFISFEPLLGPIIHWDATGIHWAIVGGESGDKARPMDVGWAVKIWGECQEWGVAFFMKQLGGWPDKHGRMEDFPPTLRVREFPDVTPAGQLEMF